MESLFNVHILPEREELPEVFKQDPFGKAYLSNIMLRPVCYDCPFSTVERLSDFTAGDFWGNGKLMPDDDKGISIVLIHSEQGKDIWSQIGCSFECRELSRERAVNGNTPLYGSSSCNLDIDQFYEGVARDGFRESVRKYIPNRLSAKQRMKYIAKVFVKR